MAEILAWPPEDMLAWPSTRGGETVIADKGYTGLAFAAAVARLGATLVRPAPADESGTWPPLAPIRQRIGAVS